MRFGKSAVARFLLLVAAGGLLFPLQALPMPNNPSVVAGNAEISQSGTEMTITQSTNKAIINWEGYSIDVDELVRYIQPGKNAVALNRITGGDPSVILGQLLANGQIFVINPAGVIFGESARVNVAGLLATTLNIADSDFLSNNYTFTQDANKALGSVINKGQIVVSDNGYAVLVAPLVSNEGLIVANLGKVVIGGAEAFTVNFDNSGLINFAISSPVTGNPGTVLIPTSQVSDIIKEVVNAPALIEAGSVVEQDGMTYLANASGTVINTGTIRVDGAEGKDAGTIIIDSNLVSAIVPGSVLSASGIGANSKGGNIYVLSEGNTALTPGVTIEAKGGDISGDGGFVEASAGKNIYLGATVDTRAVNGATGTFLIDPTTLYVADGSRPGGNTYTGGTYGGFLDTPPTDTIYETELEGATSNIVLQATQNITVQNISDDIINILNAGISISMQTIGTGSISFTDTNDTIQTNNAAINISNPNGTVALGNLVTGGGSVGILAQYGTVGNIDTSSISGDGGAVSVTYTGTGTATFGNINTSSSNAGSAGGDIQITGSNVDMTIGVINTTPGAGGTAGNVSVVAKTVDTGDITTGGGSVTFALGSGESYFNGITTDGGEVSITGGENYTFDGAISSNGGNVLISSDGGYIELNNNLASNGGDITIVGADSFVMDSVTGIDADTGSLTISAGSGNITLYALTTNGSDITITSSGGALTFNDGVATSDGQLIVTGHDTITQVTGTTIDTGAGDITFSADNDITIADAATTGTAAITSTSGSIMDDSDGATDLTAGTVVLSAGDNTTTGTSNIDIDLSSADITATADNNVDIANSTASNTTATLTSRISGDITFNQTGGGNVDATAQTTDGGITISNAGGDITATSVIAGNSGDILLDTTGGTGSIYVADVETEGLVTIKSGGGVEEETLSPDPNADINANELIIGSSAGVGVLEIIEIDANTLAVFDASNSGVYLVDTAGGLTIGTIGAYSGITTSNGEVSITTNSPLIINAPIDAGAANIVLTASNSDGYIEVNSSITNSGAFDITLIAQGVNGSGQSIIMDAANGSINAGQDAILTANSADSGDIIVSSITAGRNITITADNTGATPTGSILDDDNENTFLQAGVGGTVSLTADEDIGSNTGTATIPEGYLDIDMTNSPTLSITTNSGDAYLRFVNNTLHSSDFTGLSVGGSNIGIAIDGYDLVFDDGTFTELIQNLTFIADNIYLSYGFTGNSINTTEDVTLKAIDGVIQDTADGFVDIIADDLVMEAKSGIEGDNIMGSLYIETSVNSLTASITDSSATGNIAVDNDKNITINGLTNSGSGYIDVYAAGSMVVNGDVTTQGGDIWLYADEGLSVNADITSNNGYIYLDSDYDWDETGAFVQGTSSTIDAGTNMLDIYLSDVSTLNDIRGNSVFIYFDGDASIADNGTTSVTATNFEINGLGSNLLSGGINLNTAVNYLEIGNFNNSSGDIIISNTGDLTLTDWNGEGWGYAVYNPTGAVTISTSSPLTVAAAVNAFGDITLTAGGTGDDDLTINVTTPGSGIQSLTGDITLQANKDVLINAGVISTITGDIIITADYNSDDTGAITQSGGTLGLGGEDLIASAAEGITLGSTSSSMMSVGSITATNGAGDVSIYNNGSLTVNGITNDGFVGVYALSYGGGTNPSITVAGNINSGTGDIYIEAEGSITQNDGTTISSNDGDIAIEADVESDGFGSITQIGSATISSDSGDIWVFIDSGLSTGQNISITNINASITGEVILATTGGEIIDNDTTDDNDITAHYLFIMATEGIGRTNSIETTVTYLDVYNDGIGDVNISNTGTLALMSSPYVPDGLSVYSGGGDVNISTASTILIADPIETNGGDLSLTATTGISQNAYIFTGDGGSGAGDYTADAGTGVYTMTSTSWIDTTDTGGDGDVSITAGDDITITDINAGIGTVSLTSGASILDDNDDTTYITAGTINLTAAVDIGSTDGQSGIRPGFIDIDPTNLGSGTITLTGAAGSNIYLNFEGDFESGFLAEPGGVSPNNGTTSINSLTIGADNITINSDIFNVDDDGNSGGIYYDLYLLANSGLTLTNDIVTNENILELATGGDLTLTMANITFNNPDGTLILWADFDNSGTGSITGGTSGSPINLTNVENLILIAAEGINIYTVADPINIAAYNSTSGEINIDNVGDITVFDGSSYVGVPGIDVNGINNEAGGDVSITAHSDVTIDAPINTFGGDLTISATGSIIHTVLGDITTSGGTYTGNFDSDDDLSGYYEMADDGSDASVIDIGTGDVYIYGGLVAGGEGITISQIIADTTSSSVYLLTASGSISETENETGGYDISANQLVMAAADGIEIDNLQISYLTAENSTSGDIILTNTAPTAAGLTITNSAVPYLTGVQNYGGNVSITENSPITISAPVFATGDITLIANDSVGSDDGSITNNATVTSSGGDVNLYAGTDINIGANIQAADTLNLFADDSTVAYNDSTGTGSVVRTSGTIIAPAINLTGVDIGTSGNPIVTDAGTLSASAGSGGTTGGVYISELNQIALGDISTYDGDIEIDAGGTIDVAGDVVVGNGNTISLTSIGGGIVQSGGVVGDDGLTGEYTTLILSAVNGINLTTDITNLQATNTTSGNIEIANTGTSDGIRTYGSGVVNSASGGGIKIISENPVIINEQVTANGGNIEISSANEFLIYDVISTSGTGAITLTATGLGDIELFNLTPASIQTDDGDITLTAAGYIAMGSNISITSDTGDIGLNAGGDIYVATITTGGGGDVSLYSIGGAIIDNNGTGNTNVTARSLLALASSASGVDLDTDVNVLNALVTSGGDIDIREVNGIILGGVATSNGDITIVAGGDVEVLGDVSAGGADGDVDLTANGVGSDITLTGTLTATDAITLTADDLITGVGLITGDLLTATAGNGISINTNINTLTAITTNSNISLTEQDGLALNDVNAGTGDVTITLLAGALNSNGGTEITGNDLVVNGVDAVNINTNVDTLTVTTNNADITVAEDDGLALNLIDAGTGNVDIQLTNGEITDKNGDDLNIIGTDLILSAATGIGSGDALETAVTNLSARVASGAATGNIEIVNTGDLTLGNLAGWGDAVRNYGSGNITITVNSNLTIEDPVVSNGGGITLTANSGAIEQGVAGDITTLGGHYMAAAAGPYIMADGAVVNTGAGIIDIEAGGDIVVGQLISTATVYLESDGAIVDGGDIGGVDIQATAAELIAENGIGTATDAIDTQISNMSARTTNGQIYINQTGNLLITTVGFTSGISITNGGPIWLNTNGGSLTLFDANQDISSNGGPITILAGNVIQNNGADIISSGGNIELTIDSLTQNPDSKIDAGSGNVNISATGDISLDEIKGEVVQITGGGSIEEQTPDGERDITATDLVLRAFSGIGSANILETSVSRLNAYNSDSGDIQIDNSGDLTIDNFAGVGPGYGIANDSGDVYVDADGSIDIPGTHGDGVYAYGSVTLISTGNITAGSAGNDMTAVNAYIFGSGSVYIEAEGEIYFGETASADIIAPGDIDISGDNVTINNFTNVESFYGGDINIFANDTINLFAPESIMYSTAIWADEGSINLQAGNNIYADGTILPTVDLYAALSITMNAGGDIAFRFATVEADDSLSMTAVNNVSLIDTPAISGIGGSFVSGKNIEIITTENVHVIPTEFGSEGNIEITATDGDITISANNLGDLEVVSVAPDGHLNLTADNGNIIVENAIIDTWRVSGERSSDISISARGITIDNSEIYSYTNNTSVGYITIEAMEEDLTINNSTIYSKDLDTLANGGDITLTGGEDIFIGNSNIETVGTGNIEILASAGVRIDPTTISAGDDIIITSSNSYVDIVDTTLAAGEDIDINGATDVNILRSGLSADGEVYITAGDGALVVCLSEISAGEDVTMEAAEDIILCEASEVIADGDAELNAGDSVYLGYVEAGDTVTITAENGGIFDNNDDNINITSSDIYLSAVTGIGSANAIETQADTLYAENTDSGNIWVRNNTEVSGDLVILGVSNDGGMVRIENGYIKFDNGTLNDIAYATGGDIILEGQVLADGRVVIQTIGSIIDNNDITAFDVVAGETSEMLAFAGTIGTFNGRPDGSGYNPVEVSIDGDLFVYASDEEHLVSVAIDGAVEPKDVLSTYEGLVPPGLILFNGRMNGGERSPQWFRGVSPSIVMEGNEQTFWTNLLLKIINENLTDMAPAYWKMDEELDDAIDYITRK